MARLTRVSGQVIEYREFKFWPLILFFAWLIFIVGQVIGMVGGGLSETNALVWPKLIAMLFHLGVAYGFAITSFRRVVSFNLSKNAIFIQEIALLEKSMKEYSLSEFNSVRRPDWIEGGVIYLRMGALLESRFGERIWLPRVRYRDRRA